MRLFERLRRGEQATGGFEPPAVEAGQLLDLATGLLVRHFLELGVAAWREGRRIEFRQHGVGCELRLEDLTSMEVALGCRIRLDFRAEPLETSLASFGAHHREVVGHLVELLATGVLAPILRLEGADPEGLPVDSRRAASQAPGFEPAAWRIFAGEPAVFGESATEVRALEESLRQDRDLLCSVEPFLAALMAGVGDTEARGFHWWNVVVMRSASGSVSGRAEFDGSASDDAVRAVLAAVPLPGTHALVCRQFGVMRAIGVAPPDLAATLAERGRSDASGLRWVID